MKKIWLSLTVILMVSFLCFSASAKDHKKFPINSKKTTEKDSKKAPQKSWDEKDFDGDEEGRDVAADEAPSDKNEDKAQHWDYKED